MSGRGSQPVRVLSAAVHPQAWLVTGVILGLGAGQSMGQVVPPWAVALCVVAATITGVAGRRARRVGGQAAILGAGAISAIALSLATGSSWSVALIVVVLACGAPWLGGRYLHQQDELADEAAERARLQERSRIAQDMHDSLGHELNLLALRAGAIEMDTTLTAARRAEASELRAGASSAITQLAAVIGMLRGDEPVAWRPTERDIAELVQRAAEAGMDVKLERNSTQRNSIEHVSLQVPDLAVARCIHRVVEEGITNAAHHAPGSTVSVTIDTGTDETQVTVTNTPPNTSLRRAPGSQTGFVALQERLQACGGTFSAGPHHGGFRLAARVPHESAR